MRRAIAVTGAAKYFWLAPWMLTRTPVAPTYDTRSAEAIFAGRTPVFELLVQWAEEALSSSP